MFSPQYVTLPADVIAGLTAVVGGLMMFVVTMGVKNVLEWLHIDLSGVAAGLVAALTGVVVAFIVGLIGFIPEEFGGITTELVRFLLMLLSGFGFYTIYKLKVKAKALEMAKQQLLLEGQRK